MPSYVESQLVVIDVSCAQLKLAEKAIKKLAESDPVCVRLMTVPGVGPITSLRFVSALDDGGRFPTAHRAESCLGLGAGILFAIWRDGTTFDAARSAR